MFLIFGALDKYREVILVNKIYHKGESVDIEIESISSYKIGKIFFKIFKDMVRAKPYFMSAIIVAQDLERNLMMEDWYKDAVQLVDEINAWEETIRIKDKEPYLEQLKDVLALIKDQYKNSIESFIKYLIKNHPPTEGFVFDVDEQVKTIGQRKLLVTMIMKYHPDKHANSDMLKKVKMEEITKYLNNKLEIIK